MSQPKKRATWRTVWVRISYSHVDGSVEFLRRRGHVTASAPGLAVTRGFNAHAGEWVITHRLTGLRVPVMSFAKQSGAKAAVLSLAALGSWNRPAAQLKRSKKLYEGTRAMLKSRLREFLDGTPGDGEES